MELKEQVGIAIKNARLAKGFSVQDLAEKSKVKANTIYRYESGRYLAPTKTLERIASALGVTVEVIFKS